MEDLEILDFMEKVLDLQVNWIDKSSIGFSLYTTDGYKVEDEIVRSSKVGLNKGQIMRAVYNAIFKYGKSTGTSENQANLRVLFGIEE